MKNHLSKLRDEAGWSQGKLAQNVGCSRQWLSGVEAGRVNPSLPLALRIAKVLNHPVNKVFELEKSELDVSGQRSLR